MADSPMSRWYEVRIFVKAENDAEATMLGLLVDKALTDHTRASLYVGRTEEKGDSK